MGDSALGRHYRTRVKPDEEMDTDWVGKALCKGEPTFWFFGDDTHYTSAKLAKEICSRCPVAMECLQYALDAPIEYGIWGGLTSNERWRYRRKMLRNRP